MLNLFEGVPASSLEIPCPLPTPHRSTTRLGVLTGPSPADPLAVGMCRINEVGENVSGHVRRVSCEIRGKQLGKSFGRRIFMENYIQKSFMCLTWVIC